MLKVDEHPVLTVAAIIVYIVVPIFWGIVFIQWIVSEAIRNDLKLSTWISEHPAYVIPMAITIGVILYSIRGRFQFWYGSLEVFFAVGALWFSVTAPEQRLLSRSIGIFGAVCILVRELDNIGKGLPSRLRPWWYRWVCRAQE